MHGCDGVVPCDGTEGVKDVGFWGRCSGWKARATETAAGTRGQRSAGAASAGRPAVVNTRGLPSAARLTTDNRRLTLCIFLRVFASSREASSLEN